MEGDAAGRAAASAAARSAAPAARAYAVADRLPAFGAAPVAPPPIRADRRAKAFVDFQNDVCAKDVSLAVQEGMRSIEHIKRYTTTGMATDQGKLANMNALAIAAAALKKPIPRVGLTTFRPPYTPVTFGAFAGPARGEMFDPIRRTPIHDWAAENGAAFEDVGQWKRAWYFPRPSESMHDAVARECRTTRGSVGLFDASTLGKIEVVGPDAATFLERMYANAFQKLEVGRCRYGLMLSEAGFLMDDGVIARLEARPVPRDDDDRREPTRARAYGGLSPDRVHRSQGLAHFDHRAMGDDRRAGTPRAGDNRPACRGRRSRQRRLCRI